MRLGISTQTFRSHLAVLERQAVLAVTAGPGLLPAVMEAMVVPAGRGTRGEVLSFPRAAERLPTTFLVCAAVAVVQGVQAESEESPTLRAEPAVMEAWVAPGPKLERSHSKDPGISPYKFWTHWAVLEGRVVLAVRVGRVMLSAVPEAMVLPAQRVAPGDLSWCRRALERSLKPLTL